VVTKANIAAIYYVDLMKNWNFIYEGLLGKSLFVILYTTFEVIMNI